jgi:rhamnose transport system substrate-binding protein
MPGVQHSSTTLMTLMTSTGGHPSYYVTYLLAAGAIEVTLGERFVAGRMGTHTIEKDPTRDAGLRVLIDPFKVYDKDNVEAEAQ